VKSTNRFSNPQVILGNWLTESQFLLLLTPEGVVLWASPAVEKQLSPGNQPVLGHHLLDIFETENRTALQHQMGRAVRHDGIWHGFLRPLQPTLTLPLLRISLLPFTPPPSVDNPPDSDTYLCLLLPARPEELPTLDTLLFEFATRLRATERALCVVETDAEGIILSATPPFLRVTGYELTEIVGRGFHELLAVDEPDSDEEEDHEVAEAETKVSPEDTAGSEARELLRASLFALADQDNQPSAPETLETPFRIQCKDERIASLLIYVQPVLAADGILTRFHLYGYDLSEHQQKFQEISQQAAQFEERLRENQEELDYLNEELENSQIEFISHQAAVTRSICTLEMDLSGNILDINQNLLDVLGYELDEIRDSHHRLLLHEEDSSNDKYNRMWEGFTNGEPMIGTFRKRHKDGYDVWLVGSYNAILDAEGEVRRIVKYAFDITIQKKQERDLRQALEEQATAEEELRMNMEEIQTINEELEGQRINVEHLLGKVRDSLNYAGRIQTAMIPNMAQLHQVLPANYRVDAFFRPRDIVSGDFYWIGNWNHRTVLAVGDGTGHGVPGSFMSLIGMSVLQKLVERGITDPVVLLEELDYEIRRVLSQEAGGSLQDSIEIVICCVDQRHGTVNLASANRPVWRYSADGSLEEFSANRIPVGGAQHLNKTFDLKILEMEPGQCLYLLSDGIQDQFGGPRGRKWGRKALQTLLSELTQQPFEERIPNLKRAYDSWRGLTDQIDDVMCIALEYKGQ